MATSGSGEDVHPATPVLASALLDIESGHIKTATCVEPFYTGITRLDADLPQALWRGGKVIGILSDRAESKLAEQLIATHLGRLEASASRGGCDTPSTFIIAPPNTSVASTIHNLLKTRLPTISENTCIQLLDTVQIMRYFDFAGLAESFSEVATSLHNFCSGSATLSTSHGMVSPSEKPYVLLMDGLCPALESTQRRSGVVQANALAASLLRSVAYLSRSHPTLLVLLSLEASRDARGGNEIMSAFSNLGEIACGVSPGGLLQRTILEGIDTVVLLHDMGDAGLENGNLIVEVVKDRVGAGLGQWVVWPKSA